MGRDDEFRARVAAAVDEDTVGRAGWLWLTRPDDWAEEVARIETEVTTNAAAAFEERDERDARRRLAAARAAAERATAAATARQQEAAGIRAELLDERARRRAAEAQIADLQAELSRAQEERTAAVRQLKQVEGKLVKRAAEVKETKARLREAEQRHTSPRQASITPPSIDPVALAAALDTATRSTAALAQALQELQELTATVLDPTRMDAPESPRASDVSVADGPDLPDALDRQATPDPRSPSRRTPVALPSGIRDDSQEALDHLLRTPGLRLLVDGYNVSMLGWPDRPVAEQRHRLVATLAEAVARCGTTADVVFDGAAVDEPKIPRSVRQFVHVRFSPPGVEADDVVLDLLGDLPPARPVAVASSDNRVRDGARRLGANLVHARQLVDLLRR